MKQSINFTQFCDAFRDADRNNNFSYDGKRVLFYYLEEYEEDTGQEIELDIIQLCCEYSESTTEEVARDYSGVVGKQSITPVDCDWADMTKAQKEKMMSEVEDFLNENTTLIGSHSGNVFVYAQF